MANDDRNNGLGEFRGLGQTPNLGPSPDLRAAAREGAKGRSAYGVRRQGEMRNRGYRNAAMDAAESNALAARPQEPQRNRHLNNALQKLQTQRNQTVLGAQLRDNVIQRGMQQEQNDRNENYRYAMMGQQGDQFNRGLNQAGEQFDRTDTRLNRGQDQAEQRFRDSLSQQERHFLETLDARRNENNQANQRWNQQFDWQKNMYTDQQARADEQQDYNRSQTQAGIGLGLKPQYTDESIAAFQNSGNPADLVARPQGMTREKAELMGKQKNAMLGELEQLSGVEDPTDDQLRRMEDLRNGISQYDQQINQYLGGGQQPAGQQMGPNAQAAMQQFPKTAENISAARRVAKTMLVDFQNAPPEQQQAFAQVVAVINNSQSSDADMAMAMSYLDQLSKSQGLGGMTPAQQPPRQKVEQPKQSWWKTAEDAGWGAAKSFVNPALGVPEAGRNLGRALDATGKWAEDNVATTNEMIDMGGIPKWLGSWQALALAGQDRQNRNGSKQ